MKKYVKPDLYYENFELSHSVASCSMFGQNTKEKATHSDGGSCVFDLDGAVVFSNDNCKFQYEFFQGYCYQTGKDGYSFFSS